MATYSDINPAWNRLQRAREQEKANDEVRLRLARKAAEEEQRKTEKKNVT